MIPAVEFSALAVACLSCLACGQLDCAYPTSGDIASVIQRALRSGDASSRHDINVTAFRPLCLAHSAQKNRYRGVSVLVQYTCRGPATCPRGVSVEQFESACVDGRWSHSIYGSTAGSRTLAPTATFSTTRRDDCAYCLSPALARSIGAPSTPDDLHHCVECAGCGGTRAQNRCTGLGCNACCSVYVEDMCDSACPTNGIYVLDEEYSCRPQCPSFDHLVKNAVVDYSRQEREAVNSYSVGTIATITCDPGFRGGGFVTCTSRGAWSSSPPPHCEAVDCGEPLRLLSGRVAMLSMNTSLNSVALYECEDGHYFEVGSKTSRICRESGEWSTGDINCLAYCGEPEGPANGDVTVHGRMVNSVAIYSCKDGYTVRGGSTRVCLRSGRWSGSDSTCTVIDCGLLPGPANGVVAVTDTVFDSAANYSCTIGYSLLGHASRICQENGLWSNSEPSCTVVDCGPLVSLAHGKVKAEDTIFNSVATYSCNVGHLLTGDEIRICLATGLWSGAPPTCTGAPCNLSGLQASIIIFVLLCIVLAVALVISLVALYRLRRGFVYVKSRGRRISLGGPSETYNRLNDGDSSVLSRHSSRRTFASYIPEQVSNPLPTIETNHTTELYDDVESNYKDMVKYPHSPQHASSAAINTSGQDTSPQRQDLECEYVELQYNPHFHDQRNTGYDEDTIPRKYDLGLSTHQQEEENCTDGLISTGQNVAYKRCYRKYSLPLRGTPYSGTDGGSGPSVAGSLTLSNPGVTFLTPNDHLLTQSDPGLIPPNVPEVTAELSHDDGLTPSLRVNQEVTPCAQTNNEATPPQITESESNTRSNPEITLCSPTIPELTPSALPSAGIPSTTPGVGSPEPIYANIHEVKSEVNSIKNRVKNLVHQFENQLMSQSQLGEEDSQGDEDL